MLWIYINDLDGNVVNDPSQSAEYASSVSVESLFPKGYSSCTFVVRRDIAASWLVKSAYDVIIRDGLRIVFQGLLKDLKSSLSSNKEEIKIEARGYYAILAHRIINKRWVDNAAFSRFYWPSSQFDDEPQQRINSTIRGNLCRVRLPGSSATSAPGDDFIWRYDGVPTDTIIKVVYDYYIISGSGDTFRLEFINGSDSTIEEFISVNDTSSSATGQDSGLWSGGDTSTFDFKWLISGTTDGDADGHGHITNLLVYFQIAAISGVPFYYADEIIKDILSIVGASQLSTDYSQVDSPALALIPFTTNDYETADQVIQRAVGYGDASNNTWAFSVWDKEYKGASSDGKPKVELKQRPTLDDYEYQVSLHELSSFNDSLTLDQLQNYIVVQYTDSDGDPKVVSPDTNTTLTDAVSVATYYRRDKFLSIGKSSAAKAVEYGERYLALHKDPLRKTSLSLVGPITAKAGHKVPGSWVRAGDRVKIIDHADQPILLLGRVAYDDDTQRLMCEADLPPDDLAIFTAQQNLQVNRLA